MNKKLCLLAAAAAVCLAVPAHANWITAPKADLTVSEGGAVTHMPLTSSQWLYVDMSVKNSGSAGISFYTSQQGSSLDLSSVPVSVKEGNGMRWGYLSVTPVINDGNGARYYIIDTGSVGGCRIIAYTKGTFKTAFAASDIPGTWASATIKVEKKTLSAVLTKEDGSSETYPLQWNKKTETFQTVLVSPGDE